MNAGTHLLHHNGIDGPNVWINPTIFYGMIDLMKELWGPLGSNDLGSNNQARVDRHFRVDCKKRCNRQRVLCVAKCWLTGDWRCLVECQSEWDECRAKCDEDKE